MDRSGAAISIIFLLGICVFIYAKLLRASIVLLNRKVWSKPGVAPAWEPGPTEAMTISGAAMAARGGLFLVVCLVLAFFVDQTKVRGSAYMNLVLQHTGEFALLTDAIVIMFGIGASFIRAIVISIVTWLMTVLIVGGSVLLVWLLVPGAREIFR